MLIPAKLVCGRLNGRMVSQINLRLQILQHKNEKSKKVVQSGSFIKTGQNEAVQVLE